MRHKVFCRQTLMGGNYELVDKESFLPNPDYWTALLWKRLMGTKVLEVTPDKSTPHLRAYAHCGHGQGLTVAFINLAGNETYDIAIEGLNVASLLPRIEFHLSSDNLHSKHMYLNGELLVFENGHLPPLNGKYVSDNIPLQVAPHTYGYIHYPKVRLAAC